MSDFDPYHKWLGISPQHQPPNHYRLLSLDLYEADADVIEASVDRLAAFLQDVATGSHAAASQQLLNEISAARLCLLDESAKAAYDSQLKAELSAEILPPVVNGPSTPPAPSPPPPPPAPSPPPAAAPAITIDTGTAAVAKAREPRRPTQNRATATAATKRPPAARQATAGSAKKRSPLLLVSFVSAGGLIIVAAVYALLAGSEARRRAADEAPIRERYDGFAGMRRNVESTLPDFTPNYEANPLPQPQKKQQPQKKPKNKQKKKEASR